MSRLKQRLLFKKKEQKEEAEAKTKQTAAQKVAVHALQKQLQNIKLKEWLMLSSFAVGAALLRVPMQAVPSAEPLSFFAILSGWLFGKKKGFIAGAAALYISNFFVIGGHGPWTLFQALGFGVIGWLGGFLRGTKAPKSFIGYASAAFPVLIIALLGTIIFEIIMNISSSFFFGFNIFLSFFSAIPFMITHIVSNLTFALFIPLAYSLSNKIGGFNEKEVALKLIRRLRSANIVIGSDNNNRQNSVGKQ